MENRYLEAVKRKETITSLELLEQINFFRKQEENKSELGHNDLLKIIRNEFEEEIHEGKISQMFYDLEIGNGAKRKSPMFELTLSQSKQVLMRESKFVRKAVIQYIEKLEKELSGAFKVPTTMKEALLLALEQQEQIEKLEAKQLEDKPKVDFYNDVTESKDTIDMATVAKVLNVKNVGRNKLFEILRDKKVLMQNNQPYQKYIDNGWFRQIESKWTKPNGDIGINIKTVVFQKGVDGIRKVIGE